MRALSTSLLPIALTLMLAGFSWAQSMAVRRIAVLTPGGDFAPVLEGLRQGLAQLGYVEGKQITFIVEDTQMDTLDPVKAAMRLVESKPNLIFTVALSHAAAAKQATANIPIVFTVLSDPLQNGLITGYSSSKNNLTGVANSVVVLTGKRLDLLKDVAPRMRRALAIVAVKENIALMSFQFLQETAKKLGVQLVRRDVTTKEDIEQVLLDTPRGSVDAIVQIPAILLIKNIAPIIDKAKKDKLPFIVHTEELVKKGALVSYGEDYKLLGIQAARLVVKVLHGTKPSEIPIETPEQPVLVVNRTTAKIIGLKITREFLERVDRFVD
jgi:putative ABC transport system substrate-binding protein